MAHVLHRGPGSGDERARARGRSVRRDAVRLAIDLPGTSNAGGGVHATDPVGVHVVLEAAELGILVHDH